MIDVLPNPTRLGPAASLNGQTPPTATFLGECSFTFCTDPSDLGTPSIFFLHSALEFETLPILLPNLYDERIHCGEDAVELGLCRASRQPGQNG
jgi:hypothetical protein